jgi:uncharacterized membrane protein
MSKFAVTMFPDEKKAYEGLHALHELHREGSVTVYGTDVLRRDGDGRMSILKQNDEGPIGTGVGVLTGALLGLFGGPVGAAVGATVGATAGMVRDLVHVGVSDEFLAKVERDLAPGTFAVVAEIAEEWIAPLDTRMAELGATVVREDRLAFEEDVIERRVRAGKAHFATLQAERAARKAERAADRAGTKAEAMMQKLIAEEIEEERQKLEKFAAKSEKKLDGVKGELDAKIEALLAQASGARPEVRRRIEQRMTELRSEFAEREQKLARAKELTREALQA